MLFWLNYSARAALGPLLVSVEQELGIGHTASTSLLLMQGIGFCLSAFFCGFLLNRIRPASVVGFSILACGLVLMCMPMVEGLNQGRLMFFLFGLTVGLYFPAGMATLSTLVLQRDWGKAVAVHELAPVLGFILIPLLAQAALLVTDWRGFYRAWGVLTVILALLWLKTGKGGHSYSAPPSFQGVSEIVRSPMFWAFVALLTLSNTGEFSVYSILTLYLVNVAKLGPETANMALAGSRLPAPVAVLIAGWAADRVNVCRMLIFCLLLHATALGMMCSPLQGLVLCGIVLQGVAVAALFPAIFKLFARTFVVERQALVISLSLPIASIFSAGIVPIFLGWCGEFVSFQAGLGLVALASLGCLGAIRTMRKGANY